MSETLQIVATDVLYYHEADERAFFEWLDRMAFVRKYYGVVRDLIIELSRLPTDDDLREIIGFCQRYAVDMTQLAKFVTSENGVWMQDPQMFWHNEMFGGAGRVNGS